jgi:hypothetical protein
MSFEKQKMVNSLKGCVSFNLVEAKKNKLKEVFRNLNYVYTIKLLQNNCKKRWWVRIVKNKKL